MLQNEGKIDDIKIQKKRYSWATKFSSGKTVLDLNCGDGYGTDILQKNSTRVDGVDNDFDSLTFALRNFFTEQKTKFFHSELFEYLKTCPTYELAVAFDIHNYCNINNDLQILLDLIPSHTLIVGCSGDNWSIFSKKLVSELDKIKYSYEIFYENYGKIGKSERNANGSIMLIKKDKISERIPQISNPLVSIIIPAYNSEKTLKETIDSALHQSYRNLEILIVDDGSTDGTNKLCKDYGSKIKYYYKPNGGISSALNYGIKKMNGTWFKWLSSDDVLKSDAITKLIEVANNTGGLIIYSDYDVIDETSKFVRTIHEPVFSNYYDFASELWNRFIGNASGILIHKSCFQIVGLFDESLRFGEDYEWWLRACLVYGLRFFYLPRPIVKYRIHKNQTTAKIKEKISDNDQSLRKKIENNIMETDPLWWYDLKKKREIYNKISLKIKIRKTLRTFIEKSPSPIRNKIFDWRMKNKQNMKSGIDVVENN